MAHPAPLSPLSPRESRSTVREGAGGTRRLWPVVRSQGKGSEVGARGAQGRECGVGGAARGAAGDAKCQRPGSSGRWLVAAVLTRAFWGEAKRAARRRGESALLYEWDRAALLVLLGREAECVGRVRTRAPCPVPLKRRGSCSRRDGVRAGLTRPGGVAACSRLGEGVCPAGERLPPLRPARGGRMGLCIVPEARDSRGRFGLTSDRWRWGPGLGGLLSRDPPLAHPLLGAPRLRRVSLELCYSLTAPFLGTYSPLHAGNSGAL